MILKDDNLIREWVYKPLQKNAGKEAVRIAL